MVSSENLTILKLGGSVITDKRAEDGVVKVNEIQRIAKEISGFKGKLIIVHGAGSFGHPQAKKFALNERFNVSGSIVTHLSVKELCRKVVDILNENGTCAVGVHPMCCMLADNGRIKTMFLDHIFTEHDTQQRFVVSCATYYGNQFFRNSFADFEYQIFRCIRTNWKNG